MDQKPEIPAPITLSVPPDSELDPVENWLTLQGRVFHQIARDKGWWEPSRGGVNDKIILFHAEISEAVEEYRAGHSLNEVYFVADKHGQVKPEGVPIEFADLLIRLLDFCQAHDIDLDKAVRMKHAFNIGRPYAHGGKKF